MLNVYKTRAAKVSKKGISGLLEVLSTYGRGNRASETRLFEMISKIQLSGAIDNSERIALQNMKALVELRFLSFGLPQKGSAQWRSRFGYCAKSVSWIGAPPTSLPESDEIFESALYVLRLWTRLRESLLSSDLSLRAFSVTIYEQIFCEPYEEPLGLRRIEDLTALIAKDGGIPFMILNAIHRKDSSLVRELTQAILTSQLQTREDLRTGLYWISEILWFSDRTVPIKDHETAVRYLFHLCFTDPNRVGFLEIDSRFYSEFEAISELAREAFLFKDFLVETLFYLWKDFDIFFDTIFQKTVETLFEKKSKIYKDRGSWEQMWIRESGEFCKDYLHVVEGNLFYASNRPIEALQHYEKALRINPGSRSALFNALLASAKLKNRSQHARYRDRIEKDRSFLPSSLYIIGDSFLLLGEMEISNSYFNELSKFPGWGKKTDYYRSLFCFEQGVFELALEFALKARDLQPSDFRIGYHVSVCYHMLGDAPRALEAIERIENVPGYLWVEYYRFMLQRDCGKIHEAEKTLFKIPPSYFTDAEELEQVLEFARRQKSLPLLRHLKKR